MSSWINTCWHRWTCRSDNLLVRPYCGLNATSCPICEAKARQASESSTLGDHVRTWSAVRFAVFARRHPLIPWGSITRMVISARTVNTASTDSNCLCVKIAVFLITKEWFCAWCLTRTHNVSTITYIHGVNCISKVI